MCRTEGERMQTAQQASVARQWPYLLAKYISKVIKRFKKKYKLSQALSARNGAVFTLFAVPSSAINWKMARGPAPHTRTRDG